MFTPNLFTVIIRAVSALPWTPVGIFSNLRGAGVEKRVKTSSKPKKPPATYRGFFGFLAVRTAVVVGT